MTAEKVIRPAMDKKRRLPKGMGYGPDGRVMTKVEFMALLEEEMARSLTPEEKEKRITVWRRHSNGVSIVKGDMS